MTKQRQFTDAFAVAALGFVRMSDRTKRQIAEDLGVGFLDADVLDGATTGS